VLLFEREVLPSEKDDTTLGNQQRQLILLPVRQPAQLDPLKLGPDIRREILDRCRRGEKGRLLRVCEMRAVGRRRECFERRVRGLVG